jgi:hypothetical protein
MISRQSEIFAHLQNNTVYTSKEMFGIRIVRHQDEIKAFIDTKQDYCEKFSLEGLSKMLQYLDKVYLQ